MHNNHCRIYCNQRAALLVSPSSNDSSDVEDCDLIIQYRIYELCNHHVYDIQFLTTLSVVVYYTVYNNNSFKNLVVLYIWWQRCRRSC